MAGTVSDTGKMCQDGVTPRVGVDVCVFMWDGRRVFDGCIINPLTPNDHCSGRTAPLTSKVAFYIFIQQI